MTPFVAPMAAQAGTQNPYFNPVSGFFGPTPPERSAGGGCYTKSDAGHTTVYQGVNWVCACPYAYYLGAGVIAYACAWIIDPRPSPDTGKSSVARVAESPRAFTRQHVGLLQRTTGQFQTFSDMTVLNRDNGGAEGRNAWNMALYHELIVWNAATQAWDYCGNGSGWYYNQQYHYFMQLTITYAGAPCGAGRYYYQTGWTWQYEGGVSYYGNSGNGGVLYAPFGGASFAQAATADPAIADAAPAPPTAADLHRRPPPPQADRGKQKNPDGGVVTYNMPA